jgi:methylenetetrahydrofolate reductase (NADPH)
MPRSPFPRPTAGSAMKIGDIIKKRGGSLSFEFFPPKGEAGEARLFEAINRLEAFAPTFVSVTYGAGGGTLKNTSRVIGRIQRETSLNPMPHLTCVDQSKAELRKILEDYKGQGIDNVLALRGDPPQGAEKFVAPRDGFCYAIDMVTLAVDVGGFSIGVAVYPEGHPESPSPEMDMYYARQKIDAGADFAITQMFFDNSYFYGFLERAEKAGITIPIIPGIMPITGLEQIQRFCKMCGATLPGKIVRRLEKAGDEVAKAGVEVATEQCADLLEHGVRYFHFYTLNQAGAVSQIVTGLGLKRLGLPPPARAR